MARQSRKNDSVKSPSRTGRAKLTEVSPAPHPVQELVASGRIETGIPLKDIFEVRLVELIGRSLSTVVPGFDQRKFLKEATAQLDHLEFKARADAIADAMATQLPRQFAEAAPLIIQSFGPPLEKTEGNGLAPFFYLPHSSYIARRGVEDFKWGIRANYELTRRFTAEFCIRPLLIAFPNETLQQLGEWCNDPSPHVRRLVSEGTRPRLPWGIRLQIIQRDPELTLPLLDRLKNDPELYVRRSVANHLADIAKDHPERVRQVLNEWIAELQDCDDRERANQRFWMIRHAVRLPAKKGEKYALELRKLAAIRK